MTRLRIMLAAAAAIALSGCATSGLGRIAEAAKRHPEHCEAAMEVLREGVRQGAVPAGIPEEELELILHRIHAGLIVAGICPLPGSVAAVDQVADGLE